MTRPCMILWLGWINLVLAGCSALPDGEAFFEPTTLAQRQIQTRLYEFGDEIRILQASLALLLDNGFQISQVDNRLGWAHAYKVAYSQSSVSAKLSTQTGVFYATLVTSALHNQPGTIQVRVTFHWANYASETSEGDFHLVENPAVYQQFFSRLSKTLFLEEHRT